MTQPNSTAQLCHFLVIENEDGDYFIEHDDACPKEDWLIDPDGRPIPIHTCAVGTMVHNAGLEALDGWRDLAPGRYEIRFWSQHYPATAWNGGEEWDAGLELVDA